MKVIAPMFISEIAETSVRGAFGAFFQLFLTVGMYKFIRILIKTSNLSLYSLPGILFVYIVGAVTNWINLSVACAIFPVFLIVAVFFIPDSPIYLVKQSRRIDAGIALKWFWGQQCDTQAALQNIQNDLDSVQGDARLSDLVTNPANRGALIISLSLMFFQQFSGKER